MIMNFKHLVVCVYAYLIVILHFLFGIVPKNGLEKPSESDNDI